MTIISATDARARLPEILDRVARGEEITITRHDKVVAVVLSPDAVRHRRAAASEAIERAVELAHEIDAQRDAPPPRGPGISNRRAEQLVRELRAERDAH